MNSGLTTTATGSVDLKGDGKNGLLLLVEKKMVDVLINKRREKTKM